MPISAVVEVFTTPAKRKVRVGIVHYVDLTAEFTRNSAMLETEAAIHPDEGLVRLRVGF